MKSNVWIYTVMALLFVSLVSCTGPVVAPATEGEPAAAAPAAAEDGPAIAEEGLNVWAVHTTGPETEAAMRDLMNQFGEEYGIPITFEQVSGQLVYPKFLTAVRGAAMPDVADGYAFHPLQFAAMGQMMELDDVYAEWEEEGLLDELINEYSYLKFFWDGHYWGVPWGQDIRGICYRKDLLEQAGLEPPTNWDEFRDAVIATNNPDEGIYGLSYPGGDFHITQHYYMMFMLQAGGSILDEEANLIFGTEAKEANVEALKYLTDFTLVHNATPPGLAAYNTDEAETIFIQGRAAFALCRGGIATRLLAEAPDMVENVGILDTLQGPARKLTSGFYNPFFIWRDTENPEASVALLKWLAQPGRIEPLYEARPGQIWPVWNADFDLPVFKGTPLLDEMVTKIVPFTVPFTYPARLGVPQMGVIDGEKMFAKPVNEVLAGVKTPEQAVEDAHAAMAELWAD